jgi:hypothetical protein
MGAITEENVLDVNRRIAEAVSTAAAFRVIDGLTRTMIDKVLDLNGVGADSLAGVGMYGRRVMLGEAHGWDYNERDDDRPADGRGPCTTLGRFEPHSRRPLECRGCHRRKLDHRPVAA